MSFETFGLDVTVPKYRHPSYKVASEVGLKNIPNVILVYVLRCRST
jgi:hypothetical protein